MKLHELKVSEGSQKSPRRVGRGIGSGTGKTSGKGHKGQNSRSGGGTRLGFEGGQNPIYRRLPKRGFKNYTKIHYLTINIGEINAIEDFKNGSVVDFEILFVNGYVKGNANVCDGLKILGDGEITKKLTVKADKFSATAKEKILAAGGSVEVI